MSVAVSVPALMNVDVNHSLLVIQRQLYNKKPVLNYRNKKIEMKMLAIASHIRLQINRMKDMSNIILKTKNRKVRIMFYRIQKGR